MKKYQRYSYHGTTKEKAEKIMRTGVRKNTWFALHLEDAIEFGGEYVFRVGFNDVVSQYYWQFKNNGEIPISDRVISLKKYDIKTVRIKRSKK